MSECQITTETDCLLSCSSPGIKLFTTMYINKKLRNVSFASPISVPSVDDVASLNGRGRVLSFSFFSFVVLSSKHIQTVLCLQGSGPMVATQQVVSRTDLIYFLTLCNFSPRSIDFLYIFNQEGFSECVGKKFFAPEPFDPVCAVKVIPGRGVGWGGKKKKVFCGLLRHCEFSFKSCFSRIRVNEREG